jgi:hypothetical protein
MGVRLAACFVCYEALYKCSSFAYMRTNKTMGNY